MESEQIKIDRTLAGKVGSVEIDRLATAGQCCSQKGIRPLRNPVLTISRALGFGSGVNGGRDQSEASNGLLRAVLVCSLAS